MESASQTFNPGTIDTSTAAPADTAAADQSGGLTVRETQRGGRRLIFVNPMPARLCLLVGCGVDTGLLSINEPLEDFEKIDEGTWEYPTPQILDGFNFQRVVIISLID